MTDRELMQQALDALEGYARNCRCEGGGAPCDAAEALRARLAQPEQKPVAWLEPEWGEKICLEIGFEHTITSDHPKDLCWVPLYTAPPQREWIGLTDEEVGMLTVFDGLHHVEVPVLAGFARAIEAKLREKNNA